jgi:hypothetical protein
MAELIDPDKLVSLPEMAKEYGYNPKYLSRLASEKKIRAWSVGHTWITTRELFEEYVKSAPPPGPRKKVTRSTLKK